MPHPDPILNSADIIGRRWVYDVCNPHPNRCYLHVVGGPFWLFGWTYSLAGSSEAGGPCVSETVLLHAMKVGAEVPLGTDPLDYTCRECQTIWNPAHYSNNQIAMGHRARGLCSTCAFWDDAYRDYLDGKRVVVNANSYTIAREDATGLRGHSGARFRIQYPDGRMIESTNVWHQGQIPIHWRDRMPDTAVFLPEELSPGLEIRCTGYLSTPVRRH